MMVVVQNMSLQSGTNYRLRDISATFESGKHHIIVGPNGAGKSSLLQIIAGSIPPSSGNVYLHEQDINNLSVEKIAIQRAILSQQIHIAFPMKVLDIIHMGRYPHKNSEVIDHENLIDQIIQSLQIQSLQHRWYQSLSGGEAQKVQLARVLVQLNAAESPDQKLLLLDEPVSHLDPQYQQEIMRQAQQLVERGVTVISVLHDINLALQFADQLYFMKNNRLLYTQSLKEQLLPELIEKVFEVQVEIGVHPITKRPFIIYL